MKEEKMVVDMGYAFAPSGRFLSLAFVLIACLIFYYFISGEIDSHPAAMLIPTVFLLIGVLGFTTKRKIDISIKEDEIFDYYLFFGCNYGAREKLSKYQDITVLRTSKSVKLSKGNLRVTGKSEYSIEAHEVFLLDKTHRIRTPIGKAKNFNGAVELAKSLAQKLNMKLVKFSPKRVSV